MRKTLKGTITFKSEIQLREAVGILNLSSLSEPEAEMTVVSNPNEYSLNIVADYKLHHSSIKTVVSMSSRKELSLVANSEKRELLTTTLKAA